MTADRAHEILGAGPGASAEERRRLFDEKREIVERKLAAAPTPGLKAKYRETLEELTRAFELLEIAAMDADLGAIRPDLKPTTFSAGPPPSMPKGPDAEPASTFRRRPSTTKPPQWAMGAGIAAVILLLGGLLWAWSSQREAARLASLRGGLVVKTVPEGAEVGVGSVVWEKAPFTLKDLKVGRHPVKARLSNFDEWSGEVLIKENEFSELVIQLSRSHGSLQVTANVPQATYELRPPGSEGTVQTGSLPLQIASLPTGKYELTTTTAGLPPDTRSILIGSGEAVREAIQFQFGRVSITSQPSEAEVFINGQKKGVTPLTLDRIPPGAFESQIKLKGFRTHTLKAKTTAGGTNSFEVNLRRSTFDDPAFLLDRALTGIAQLPEKDRFTRYFSLERSVLNGAPEIRGRWEEIVSLLIATAAAASQDTVATSWIADLDRFSPKTATERIVAAERAIDRIADPERRATRFLRDAVNVAPYDIDAGRRWLRKGTQGFISLGKSSEFETFYLHNLWFDPEFGAATVKTLAGSLGEKPFSSRLRELAIAALQFGDEPTARRLESRLGPYDNFDKQMIEKERPLLAAWPMRIAFFKGNVAEGRKMLSAISGSLPRNWRFLGGDDPVLAGLVREAAYREALSYTQLCASQEDDVSKGHPFSDYVDLLLELKNGDEAERVAEVTPESKIWGRSSLWAKIATFYLERGDKMRAKRAAASITASETSDYEYSNYALLAARIGDRESVQKHVSGYLRTTKGGPPDYQDARIAEAYMAIGEDELSVWLQRLQPRLEKSTPEQAENWRNSLAYVYARQGRLEEASRVAAIKESRPVIPGSAIGEIATQMMKRQGVEAVETWIIELPPRNQLPAIIRLLAEQVKAEPSQFSPPAPR